MDRTRERCDVEIEASEGWVDDVRLDWKVRWEVVERTNGKGISCVTASQQAGARYPWLWARSGPSYHCVAGEAKLTYN